MTLEEIKDDWKRNKFLHGFKVDWLIAELESLTKKCIMLESLLRGESSNVENDTGIP